MNTYEEYTWELLKRKEKYLELIKKQNKEGILGDYYLPLFHRTTAQIDILYMILTGHSTLINPFKGIKGKEKASKDWEEESKKQDELVY